MCSKLSALPALATTVRCSIQCCKRVCLRLNVTQTERSFCTTHWEKRSNVQILSENIGSREVLQKLTTKVVRDISSAFSNIFLLADRRLVRLHTGKMKPVTIGLSNTKNICSKMETTAVLLF